MAALPSESSTKTVTLPRLHPAQLGIDRQTKRFNALACGRRWGKSKYFTVRMARRALAGELYGYFAPDYKRMTEVFEEAASRLSDVAEVRRSEKRIKLVTGGLIEFWTLEDPDAGRSRKYHEVGIDEAGLVKGLEQLWFAAIRPTLTDYRGSAFLGGTPKGRNYFATAFAMGQDPLNNDWASWQMPTGTNPYIPADEIEAARKEMPDRLFRQEYLAEFLDEAGGVFRGVQDAIDERIVKRDGVREFSIGVDLARVEDFTVISVIDGEAKQVYFERFNQISWERQIGRIEEVYARYPNATIWLDSTGIGDPIFERLRQGGKRVTGYQFTNNSKEALIDNLAMRIEQCQVRLLDIPEQTNELLAYQYELTPSRNVRMNAPDGMHDDTVIALALAVWGTTPQRSTTLATPPASRIVGFRTQQ